MIQVAATGLQMGPPPATPPPRKCEGITVPPGWCVFRCRHTYQDELATVPPTNNGSLQLAETVHIQDKGLKRAGDQNQMRAMVLPPPVPKWNNGMPHAKWRSPSVPMTPSVPEVGEMRWKKHRRYQALRFLHGEPALPPEPPTLQQWLRSHLYLPDAIPFTS
jgi:hypothetical protein